VRAFKHEKFASKRARLRVHGHRNKVVFGVREVHFDT
jgi:hypothetical protein